MAESLSCDRVALKSNLMKAQRECSERGLLHAAKRLAELAAAINVELTAEDLHRTAAEDLLEDYDMYTLAKCYFNLKEYSRAAFFVRDCSSTKAYFLHMYATYMSGENNRNDNMPDAMGPPDSSDNEHLKTLRGQLCRKHAQHQLDGYCLYLYGVVLKKLELTKDAVEIFVESINKEPWNWSAWHELCLLITDKEMVMSLSLPDVCLRRFFYANSYLELQLNDEALKIYQGLVDNYFDKPMPYLTSQIAMSHYNKRDVENASKMFLEVQKVDPFCLEHMDSYSNLLYIKEMPAELAHLAQKCCEIDKYRVETCCVIGNYYSLRVEHEKAVLYFQRALKLNPHYLSAWTLVGHEYMEMKNITAAIQAYRQAIEVNRRDYRAWYGLGQTYEILRLPLYCLYYYRQAHQLRPNDSRMVVALGECYEKLDRLQEAKKCFWKANNIGDIEETAIFKLAKLYERLHEEEEAAAAYTEYLDEAIRQGTYNPEHQSSAYKYIATFYIKLGKLDDAYIAAQKCTEFNETREEGKAMLREIVHLRSIGDVGARMDDSYGSITTERYGLDRTPLNDTPLSKIPQVNLNFTP